MYYRFNGQNQTRKQSVARPGAKKTLNSPIRLCLRGSNLFLQGPVQWTRIFLGAPGSSARVPRIDLDVRHQKLLSGLRFLGIPKQGSSKQKNAKQSNAKQCKAMQSDAKQCQAMQSNAKHQCKAIQSNAMQRKAKQCKALQSNARQCKAMQRNAKQCNAMQSINAKQYKAMHCNATQCNTK